ncbi:TonB-dependent siderophore receptor [Roseibium limicola]|uniref:TonB-dependent siderophore receptor n=1 Tax=Roseibium limicola TaxID=2816037 RepID=A0A939ENF1_9HYPH|nr:TonB-dependent siderophore receptor [Roseibium limicola]MBO0345598.1 TonB-dependent siderophore receptor [Roseibium limicola]
MVRLTKTMTAAHLAATVSLMALSSAWAQSAATVELKQVTIEAATEQGAGVVEGYVAERSASASKTDTPLIETPRTVSVVSREQIEDQDAGSVSEALRYTPGVATEYRGQSNFHDEMYVRGFGYVQRYVNGLEYGWASSGKINPFLLERVEVLKGPASILYGQASPGGIVNMTTKQPSGATKREVELSAGTDARVGGAFDIQGTFDDAGVWSYRVAGTAERFDLVEDGLNQEGFSISPTLRWAPSEDTALTLITLFSHEPKAGFRNFRDASGLLYPTANGYIPESFLISDPDFEEYRRTQFQVGYNFEHRLNEAFKIRQNVSYNIIDTYHQSLIWGSQTTGTTITRSPRGGGDDLNQFVADNQLQSDFDTGAFRHTLLTGFDFKHSMRNYWWGSGAQQSIDWANPVYGNLGAITLTETDSHVTTAWQAGLYAQDQIEVGNLHLNFGARYDWAGTEIDNASSADQSYDDGAFTWSAGALYAFDNGISPYVSYSTSFEPALSADSAGKMFDPTTAQQWEAGVKFAPADSRIQLTASVFQIYQQNVINSAWAYDAASGSWTQSSYQTGEVRSRGFEIEGHAEVTDNFSLIASYSYIDAEITEDRDPTNVGLTKDRIPKQQASIWGKYEFFEGPLDGLSLGLGVRHIGESMSSDNSLTVPTATLVDAMASYDFGGLSDRFEGVKLQLNGSNLLDKRYTASCASEYACWYGPGRALSAKLKYSW